MSYGPGCASALAPSVILLRLLAAPSLTGMALRSLLLTQDKGTAEVIAQALLGIGVEGEHCSEGAEALERVAKEAFQIVIIDWDLQPEAGVVLKAARERKAAERPLTLAIVSEDIDVPKALQAGANSILRRPILANQLKDTLSTARDLLRARQESAMAPVQTVAPPAPSATILPTSIAGNERSLRAGEFLQSSASAPGGQFITESDIPDSTDQSVAAPVDPLQELEPVAASMAQHPSREELTAHNLPDEPRGLEWYLRKSGISRPQVPGKSSAAAAVAPAPAPAKEELVGFDQSYASSASSQTAPSGASSAGMTTGVESETQLVQDPFKSTAEEQVTSEPSTDETEYQETAQSGFRLGKGAILVAVMLASLAIAAAPQAPWHAGVLALWSRGEHAAHAWLNPQPVAPAQAPATHENFGQAGDEYKLPVAENIPDATTDPSQIRVTPVVDPTAKQPNNGSNGAAAVGQTPADGTESAPGDGASGSGVPVQENPPPGTTPTNSGGGAAVAPTVVDSPKLTPPIVNSPTVPVAVSRPVMPPPPQSHPVSAPASSTPGNVSIPSSLKSQIASMTPEASGNKPPEAAMSAIEPVAVPESTERGLLADQPAIAYPASIKGQQGTVVLQVLVGRDGTVQDAKFLQGSLMFAKAAIDGVKQWRFKPYVMNGRPVSVQTSMTIGFKPGA